MAQITNALLHETDDKIVVVLKTGEVTDRLWQLPNKTALTLIQQHLLEETIRCIEVEAYRSALVMGWSLAYDYVRQWVFDNKLADFNTYLGMMYPKKSLVSAYDDFFASDRPVSEYEFLDVLRGPQSQPNIVRDKIIDDLVHHLRERNNYAHPQFTAPSANKANAYIEQLLDVICASPFS